MTHDPQCPRIQHALEHWLSDCESPECDEIACQCDLIARVRADERAKYVPPDLPRGGEHVDYCRDLACCGCEEITEGVIAQML